MSGPSNRLCNRSLVWLMAIVAAGLYIAIAASTSKASELKPLGIEQFTIGTTMARQVPEGGGAYSVVNEPYNFTQAGGHPFALTTTIVFDREKFFVGSSPEPREVPTQDPKDAVVDLPPGLIGDPMAVPRCSLTNVTNKKVGCPPDTQLGLVRLRYFGGNKESIGPIYNVTPESGQSAEFALAPGGVSVLLTAHLVRTERGYGVTVVSNEISAAEIVEAEITFWGVPAEKRYDWMRGLSCPRPTLAAPQCTFSGSGGGESAGLAPVPFLSLGTDCAAGPSQAVLRVDSWEEPGSVGTNGKYIGYVQATAQMPAATGCGALKFEPEIETHPDTLLADAPVGLGVNVVVPQSQDPAALATPHLRDATVTLPLGMSVSPGIVDGIEACDESGPSGINFTGDESEEVGLNGELQLAPGHCPDASIVGEAEAETPLLADPVKGHVYLARPGCGAAAQVACTERDVLDGNLYKLYLELGGTGALGNSGVNIKVEGRVEANPVTGQLTAVFNGNPQLPFENLRLRMNGGPRSPLDNPPACGRALTTADFTPWSAPGMTPGGSLVAGIGDSATSSFFDVEGCQQPPSLAPGFLAGTVPAQAAKFTSFTLSISRKDREQYIRGVQVHTPPGLLGVLASVPLCGEPAAEAGTCAPASKIGTTRVASGAGSHPFEIGGDVYLTGPHEGAPFGLSIVTNVLAGPFDLGVVVVRARIQVNQADSTLTVTTDEDGPHPIPQIVFGVPLRLQHITVNIDRQGFMFNPTDCRSQQITARVSGSQAVANVASSFAVGGCRALAFKPRFSVTTSGHTSRTAGASLDAKLSYPAHSMGAAANIGRVKVSLPKQLPSRLTTLQKACAAATFNQNPSACPSASIVGIARSMTPLLPVELEGPVYFVSHGGEAFPSLVIVLQGEGVRVDLTGTTFISKAGVTSSTFKTVPDVPVNSFELYLPQGRFSALAANGNLCRLRKRLKMPTEFVAQNGAVLKQSTSISVSGCRAKNATGSIARRSHIVTTKREKRR